MKIIRLSAVAALALGIGFAQPLAVSSAQASGETAAFGGTYPVGIALCAGLDYGKKEVAAKASGTTLTAKDVAKSLLPCFIPGYGIIRHLRQKHAN